MRKNTQFIHMDDEEKVVIIYETACFEIEYNKLCELTR